MLPLPQADQELEFLGNIYESPGDLSSLLVHHQALQRADTYVRDRHVFRRVISSWTLNEDCLTASWSTLLHSVWVTLTKSYYVNNIQPVYALLPTFVQPKKTPIRFSNIKKYIWYRSTSFIPFSYILWPDFAPGTLTTLWHRNCQFLSKIVPQNASDRFLAEAQFWQLEVLDLQNPTVLVDLPHPNLRHRINIIYPHVHSEFQYRFRTATPT